MLFYCFFIWSFIGFVTAQQEVCPFQEVKCGDGLKCLPMEQLCDFEHQCEDMSDEETTLCKNLKYLSRGCLDGEVFCDGIAGCLPIETACDLLNCSYSANITNLCNDVAGKKLKPNYAYYSDRNKTIDVMQYLASTFDQRCSNSSSQSRCPPLFVEISFLCVSFSSPIKLSWTESKAFCEALSAHLMVVQDIKFYVRVLDYLWTKKIMSNFWIGGYYESNDTFPSWKWVNNRDIALGPPFWSLYRSEGCIQTEGMPACNSYAMMPRQSIPGQCVALNQEYFFYFSDENCNSRRSPLCVYNR